MCYALHFAAAHILFVISLHSERYLSFLVCKQYARVTASQVLVQPMSDDCVIKELREPRAQHGTTIVKDGLKEFHNHLLVIGNVIHLAQYSKNDEVLRCTKGARWSAKNVGYIRIKGSRSLDSASRISSLSCACIKSCVR